MKMNIKEKAILMYIGSLEGENKDLKQLLDEAYGYFELCDFAGDEQMEGLVEQIAMQLGYRPSAPGPAEGGEGDTAGAGER